MTPTSSIQYLVIPDNQTPLLLARVRWPDVAQAISPAHLEWQDDPGLFDLPYDPNSIAITSERATSIAQSWGATLTSDGAVLGAASSVIRRMPANWSNLSPAEVSQWSLDIAPPVRPQGAPSRWHRLAFIVRRNGRDEEAPPVETDRRREPRVAVHGSAQIGFGTRYLPADLLDLAGGGARLFLPHCEAIFDVGRALDPLVIVEPGASESTRGIELSAIVAWRKDSKDGSNFGVSFRSLPTAESDEVRLLVAHTTNSAPARQESQ